VRPLLEKPDREEVWPFWSSAAGKLLFQVGRTDASGPAILMLLDPMSGRVRPLVTPRAWREQWAVWSPDGKRVAYVFVSLRGTGAKSGIAEVEVASGRRSVPGPNTGPYAYFRPEYAPDGRSILAQRRGESLDAFSDLWLLEPDQAPRPLPGKFPRFADKAHFTRDGAWIVYTGRATASGPGDVFLTRPDGSGSRPLAADPKANEEAARPSPTRDEVAFISDRDGSPDLFLMDLAGGTARNLTRSPDREESAPRWSPDGERIVVQVQPYAPGRSDLKGDRVVVVDREGRSLLDTEGRMADWMPPWPGPD
jgi:Tol biopolymer transport system component